MNNDDYTTGASGMTSSATPASSAASSGISSGAQGDNVVDLLRKLTTQGAHLAQEQVSLVQAEMREAVHDLKQAIGALLGAAVVGISGLGVLLMGLAYLLGDAIDDLGLGTLIVGVVTLIVAAILYAGARKKMNSANLTPDRSINTIERTPDAATGNLNHNSGVNHGR